MTRLRALVLAAVADCSGQTLVEYAFILALLALAVIAAETQLRTTMVNLFTAVGNAITRAV